MLRGGGHPPHLLSPQRTAPTGQARVVVTWSASRRSPCLRAGMLRHGTGAGTVNSTVATLLGVVYPMALLAHLLLLEQRAGHPRRADLDRAAPRWSGGRTRSVW